MDDLFDLPIGYAGFGGALERRWVDSLQPHPQGGLLPEPDPASYRAFVADLEERGLQVPLEITKAGVVLDGHLRLRAAVELGWAQLEVRVVAPPHEVEYLLLAAIQRRQLSQSQKAALAVELDQYRQSLEEGRERSVANLKGQPATDVAVLPARGRSRDRAAKLAGVSPRTVQDAATVHAADAALFAEVKRGRLSAMEAALRVLQERREGESTEAAPPSLPETRWDVVLADPPWLPHVRKSPSRPATGHYPAIYVNNLEQLPDSVAHDAVLFLWAVNSMLLEALDVMKYWGFEYETQFVWLKEQDETGDWNRTEHELLLLGRRGSVPFPPSERRSGSVLGGNVGQGERHESAHQLVERMFPEGQKLELFGRGPGRTGWDSWDGKGKPPPKERA